MAVPELPERCLCHNDLLAPLVRQQTQLLEGAVESLRAAAGDAARGRRIAAAMSLHPR